MTIRIPEIAVVLSPSDFVAFSHAAELAGVALKRAIEDAKANLDPDRADELRRDLARIERSIDKLALATNAALGDLDNDILAPDPAPEPDAEIDGVGLAGSYPPAAMIDVVLDSIIESSVIFQMLAQVADQIGKPAMSLVFSVGEQALNTALEIWQDEYATEPDEIAAHRAYVLELADLVIAELVARGAEVVDRTEFESRRRTTDLLNNPDAFSGPKH